MAVPSDPSDQASPKHLGGPRGASLAAGPQNLSLVSPCLMFLSPTSPDHLLWCLHAVGLSFVGQPSSSLGPVPRRSERGGQPSRAWYHLPTCTPHSTLASSAHLLPESLRVWTGPQVWGRGQSFCPQHALGHITSCSGAGPWLCRSLQAQEPDGSFEVASGPATSLHIRGRTQGGAVPLGEEPPRSLGSGPSTLFRHPWATVAFWFLRKEAKGRSSLSQKLLL